MILAAINALLHADFLPRLRLRACFGPGHLDWLLFQNVQWPSMADLRHFDLSRPVSIQLGRRLIMVRALLGVVSARSDVPTHNRNQLKLLITVLVREHCFIRSNRLGSPFDLVARVEECAPQLLIRLLTFESARTLCPVVSSVVSRIVKFHL